MKITIKYNGDIVAEAGSELMTLTLFGEIFKSLALQLYGTYLNQSPQTDHVIKINDTP